MIVYYENFDQLCISILHQFYIAQMTLLFLRFEDTLNLYCVACPTRNIAPPSAIYLRLSLRYLNDCSAQIVRTASHCLNFESKMQLWPKKTESFG